jgi:hypothetical protein
MGNDEYGTFKPSNNISRAEAAAFINRVALPENRLKKELVDANYGDAYYLISEAGNGLTAGQVFNESPWNYDNRERFATIANGAEQIRDNSPTNKIELWRDVDDVTEGIVGWDFIGSLASAEDGKYFKLSDDNGNDVIALTTNGGNFYFNGKDTGLAVSGGSFMFTIKADLDKNIGYLYINGEKILADTPIGDFTVSRVRSSSPSRLLLPKSAK